MQKAQIHDQQRYAEEEKGSIDYVTGSKGGAKGVTKQC